jgi:hypothetical protein
MHFKELMHTNVCNAVVSKQDLDDVVTAMHKVFDNVRELRK